MPEGDSVHQLSHRLQFMVGREVLATQLRVPSYALADFSGREVTAIWPHGKHLFMQFGREILHTHLKMEGSWAMHLKGDRWRKPGHTARVVLHLVGDPHPRPIEVVGHSLGLVRIFPTNLYPEKMGYLGPDVLAEDWLIDGADIARTRLLADPGRPIGTALLDQQNLAGVGNEYRAEICFIAGVHPATPVAEVDVEHILDITRRLMWANRTSPVRVTTGIRRAGENSYVFGRNRKPCRRCGTLITKDMLGGADLGGRENELERVIWWCPRCQPL
ncbi:DNA-formamidopyrimidine glycosylase family protein [Corynebacterium occultum]|nr:DNA-formamidopyrimidine glycosylase family protein [Corynebacterium occultum]